LVRFHLAQISNAGILERRSVMAKSPTSRQGGIARRLLAAFMIVCAVTVVLGVVGLTQLGKLHTQAERIYIRGAVPLSAVRKVEGAFFHYTFTRVASQQVTLGAEQRAAFVAQIPPLQQSLETAVADAQAQPLVPAAATAISAVNDDLTALSKALADLGSAQQSGDLVALRAAGAQAIGSQNKIPPLIETAIQAQTAAVDAERRVADTAYRDARTMTVALLIIGAVLSVGLALAVARSLVRPVRRTVEVLERVADGDLTARVGGTGSDEIAQMGAALDRSLESLVDMIRVIEGCVGELGGSSSRLTTVAADMSVAIAEAANQAVGVTDSAEEVSRGISTLSAGTSEMAQSIREISVSATEAATVAADAMTVAAQTTQTVSKLGDSSAEIGAVIKVITAIAEQTNLLALNATIEAARAGEMGKGFAVVASEVKDLAQETAKATEDISRRVEAIQGDTAGAVEAIGRISAVIERVNGLQTTIASAVEEQNATTNEMGRNVEHAANGSSDIARNIAGVAQAAQASSAGVHAATEAAEQLAGMSRRLSSAVSRFRA
jgi:methyl-accepting chemotaxis protein